MKKPLSDRLIKVLNLYAGIGGNRKLWKNVEVTAIESEDNIADEYQRQFPDDEVITEDAQDYFLRHHNEFDFIWSSPVCKTHSNMNFVTNAQGNRRFPDLNSLYGMILYCQNFLKKQKWVVENVIPYYEPLIEPTFRMGRHYYWSNFPVIGNKKKSSAFRPVRKERDEARKKKFPKSHYNGVGSPMERGTIETHQQILGINLTDEFKGSKIEVLRNCVSPDDGLYIFKSAYAQTNLMEEFK